MQRLSWNRTAAVDVDVIEMYHVWQTYNAGDDCRRVPVRRCWGAELGVFEDEK